MSTAHDSDLRLVSISEDPCPATQAAAPPDSAADSDPKAVGKMLASLIHAESFLYALTREWRYDVAGRKFARLHLLLDEQFSEIGVRLARLGARSRELGTWHCTGHGDGPAAPQAQVAAGALQTYIIRELLGHHEELVERLKRTRSVTSGRLTDNKTAELMAALAAEHENAASMLRAQLAEVEPTAA